MTNETHQIRSRLEASRLELLDLSLRNPLLNFRPLKARGVSVVDEKTEHVFRILVSEGRAMVFDHAADEETPGIFLEDPPPEEVDGEPLARHVDKRLQTAEPEEKLHTRLLRTYDFARLALSEQGVNVLFVALGFLHWYEAESSDRMLRAPLILVPVTLERGSARQRFRLVYSGEDIGANVSLQVKLQEFGLKLPDVPDMDEFDVCAYLSSARKMSESQDRWSVAENEIELGFFSFGRFLMYRDLSFDAWPEEAAPDKHPVMEALLGEGFQTESADLPAFLPATTPVDPLVSPEACYHVLDADSSQVLTMLDVAAGRHLVIHGPPGTGKSQTIANVIAEAIGHGKRVLFVSEKMAALEVVKRRLDYVHLGDACLELHGHKVAKSYVLQELRRTLELGAPDVEEVEHKFGQLLEAREYLNRYAGELNETVGESNLTPHDIIGHLVALDRTPGSPQPLQIPGMESWSQAVYELAHDAATRLTEAIRASGPAKRHPFWGSNRAILTRKVQQDLRETISRMRVACAELQRSLVELGTACHVAPPREVATARMQVQLGHFLAKQPNLQGIRVGSPRWREEPEAIRDLVTAGKRLAELQHRYKDTVEPTAWSADTTDVLVGLRDRGSRWWRALSLRFWRARRQLKELCIGELPRAQADRLALCSAIQEGYSCLQRIEAQAGLGRELFDNRWPSTPSAWPKLEGAISWLLDVHKHASEGSVSDALLGTISAGTAAAGIRKAVADTEAAILGATEAWKLCANALEFRVQEFPEGIPIVKVAAKVERWHSSVDRFHEIVALNARIARLQELGLQAVADAAIESHEGVPDLPTALRRGYYECLWARVEQERPTIAAFHRSDHEHTVDQFRTLDLELMNHNQERLAQAHWIRMPTHDAGGYGNLGIVQRELAKKRRHLPIRELMRQAGEVVQAIKPVFMMSPMSIAAYLPAGEVAFDLVVFDEASQITPVDALGAILRGRQIVVVGDPQQLPPTSFFSRVSENIEEDDENVTAELESVLKLFQAQGAPHRMLRWHYRSRNEALIAVSNYEFYENRLVTFPGPERAGGVYYHHHPNTIYDRGKSRTNAEEARIVADVVLDHARNRPDATLGAVAFSSSQSQAITDQLERLRREHPEIEDFFNAHPHEPFFVKNLENVQGDERDVILISVGYGRHGPGPPAMNFGPLNTRGGERRLNVLITRARCECHIFTNLEPEDIRSDARGVEVLKRYLQFARDGRIELPITTGKVADSPFEDEVRAALEREGHTVDPQVGAAGYRIDLGVVDPERPGRYLLGIECDGAMYHSAQSARDRDRLREQVLLGLGWRIHRIWSTDWFRDPERCLERALAAIQEARVTQSSSSLDSASGRSELKRTSKAEGAPKLTLAPYVRTALRIHLRNAALHEMGPDRLAEWITEVVATESPVHQDQVFRRVAEAAGVGRIGARIQEALEAGVNHALRTGDIRVDGVFLWRGDMYEAPLRDWSSLDEAPAPEHIAMAELHRLIHATAQLYYGIPLETVSRAVGEFLGYQQLTQKRRAAIDTAVRRGVEKGLFEVRGEHLYAATDAPELDATIGGD